MIISELEPQTREALIGWHSDAQQQEFEAWKKNLREYGNGCKSLIANLENAKKFENFMEFLAEFNVARILRMHDVELHYESKGYEDFLLPHEGLEISVKSIMPKNYQPKDKATIFELKKLAAQDGKAKTRTVDYGHSEVHFRVEPNGAFERIEMNKAKPGYVLASEMQQKSTLIKYIKKFDQKASDKKKILLFMVQNNDCPPILFWETFYYYYKGVAMEHDQTPYDKYFGGNLKQDIAGCVFFYRPNEILCWDMKCMSDSNPAREGGEIYRFNVFAPEEISRELNRIFK